MTLILHRSDVGEDLREPLALAPRRRRLSTLAARRIPGRPCIVSIHRKGALPLPSDETVRLRRDWKNTLVGPHDTVVITYLPLGGAMGGAGGSKGGKAIGAAVAMIAVAVAAPYLVGALGASSTALGGILGTSGALTLTGKIVAAGIVAGAGYFLSKATKAKANQSEDSRPVYGVSGGGNLPRPGDRIPVNYGRSWTQPDLSQPDYFVYNGDDQILFKRLTVTGGKCKFHAIRVGEALMWTEEDGLKAPFTNAQIEFIPPGQRSQLVGTVYSSQNVAGIELPYQNDANPWAGPFPVTEPGVETTKIQLDFSFPQGAWTTHPRKPENLPTPYGVVFYYAPIDDDGNLIGSMNPLYTFNDEAATTRAIRKSITVEVPLGRYAVMARNYTNRLDPQLEQAGVRSGNTAMWDGLRAHLYNEPTRPEVTEIALKISAMAMGSTMAFSDIWVETTSILPVNTGGVWSEQPTRKAVWAALDILRNSTYGGAYPDHKIDFDTFLHYASAVSTNDTFDGQIRGPVSVYEAAATVLGVMRAEPVLVGDTWSMVRDEPRQYQKHVISRRQIVKDTSGAEFDLDMTTGDADVILEYYVNGDPRRRAEFRATIGAETITPNRIQGFGVSSHDHAVMLARWYAACAYYRRETRLLSTELAGRIMQRNDPAMIDTWFLDTTQAAGVESRSGRTLTLDVDFTLPSGAHVVLRDQTGMEWGPIAVTAGADPRSIVLDPDDVAVIETYTGRSLASLFSKTRRRLPVTVMLGTLAELSKPYIIRTAKPESANRMQITAVYDAPEVWSVLGEAVPPAPPIKEVIANEADLAPVLPWVRGYVVQKATAIVLEWSVGASRSARRYKVDIAYGTDGPFEQIYLGGETAGSYVVEYRDGVDLRIRAYAINGQGIPSLPIYTTAVLFKPVINSAIADMLVELENLTEQVRKEIASISRIGEETLRDNLKKLGDRVEELAASAATEAGASYESRQRVKIAVGEAVAAIQQEARLRIDADGALAELITTLTARMGSAEAAITLETTTRANADSAMASQIATMSAKVDSNTAAITQEATARADADGAQATQITALQTTVGGHTATLTTYGTSIDGIKVQWGVVGEIDGVTGGYVLTGMRKLDGSVYFSLGVRGDLIVDGTIYGQKLATANIITASAQIGNLIVDNLHVKNGAITQLNGSSAATSAAVALAVRGSGKVAFFAYYKGSPGTPRIITSSGLLRLFLNGNQVDTVANNFFQVRDTSGNLISFLQQTSHLLIVQPGEGTHTFAVTDDYDGGVSLVVMELSK